MEKPSRIIIGTRKSKLALWQSEHVKAQLEKNHPGLQVDLRLVITEGDLTQQKGIPLPEVGGKGLFTKELEDALSRREIDIAVHCLKDLPTQHNPEFALVAITERESPWDVFVSREGVCLQELPKGAKIGCSSLRRSSQLLRIRPDLEIAMIRGNVDTRLSKVKEQGLYDATVLAEAGLSRLGLLSVITQKFTPREMLPAPGQGALAVQALSDRYEIQELTRCLHHHDTERMTTAERSFLNELGAGCNTPVSALGTVLKSGEIALETRCLSADGRECIELEGVAPIQQAKELGVRLAKVAMERGFGELRERGSN